MARESAADLLREIPSGGEVRFTLRDLPLDEVLLTIHESRFTGSVDIGALPEVDRLYLREGAVVGVVPYKHLDAQLLGGILVEMKKLEKAELDRVLAESGRIDGVLLGQRLIQAQLIDQDTLSRACAEQARRRLFHLYEHADAPVLVREGLERLAHFHPTYVDTRPAIAYGLVVCAAPARKAALAEQAAGKRVRLVAKYDEKRNSYGLPPPVLQALRELGDQGIVFRADHVLPGLNRDTTAGLLLLLQRISLLRLEDV